MAEDYLFTGTEPPSNSPADSFVEGIAAAGGLAGAAFLYAKKGKGYKALNHIDSLIGDMQKQLSRFSDDGANALSLSEIGRGINSLFDARPQQSFVTDGKTDTLRDAMKRLINIDEYGDNYARQIHFAAETDNLSLFFKERNVSQATIDNFVDIMRSKPSSQIFEGDAFSRVFKEELRDYTTRQSVDDPDGLLEMIQELRPKKSFEDWMGTSQAQKIRETFVQQEQADIIEVLENLQAQKAGQVHDFSLDDFLASGRDNGELDVIQKAGEYTESLSPDKALGEIGKRHGEFVENLVRNAKFNASSKIVDGTVLNTPNLIGLKDKGISLFEDTLFGKLMQFDDRALSNQTGTYVFSNSEFKLGTANFQEEGSLLVRSRDKLYRQNLDSGERTLIDTSGYEWYAKNSEIVHNARVMNQYGVHQEKSNFFEFGNTSNNHVTDVKGNNLYAMRHTSLQELSDSEKVVLGERAYSFSRAVQGIDISLEKNTEKLVIDMASQKEGIKKDALSLIKKAYQADSEAAKRKILKNIDVDQIDILDTHNIIIAAKKGKRIGQKLTDDSVGLTSKSLYKIKSVNETINDSLVKSALSSLGKTKEEVYAKINSLNISEGQKQKLRDIYNIEEFKKDAGLQAIKTPYQYNAKNQSVSEGVFSKIQQTLKENKDADKVLGFYLGNNKDYYIDYGKKGNAAASVLARKTVDVKRLIKAWNSGDLNDFMGGISDAVKGLIANSKLEQTTFLSKLTGGHIPINNNTTGNDLSWGGSFLYKQIARLSEGLNLVDPTAWVGVTNNDATRFLARNISISKGLGFNENASRSTLELVDKLLFKRVLPVSFLYTQLDWADDTFDINENFQIGLANIDLAFRRFTDNTGLTDILKLGKMANPMAQYISGDYRPYQSYEERLDYYRNGKDPIRSGRYWVWGSSNEFRGGSISYWEDNSLKLAQSDYRTESIYGGYFNKWARSPIPTLSNPLSPIIYALNPYWVEERNMEDRPYLMSGPMFEQNTLAGLILNPTIGELIKPQRMYHQDRMWFGRDVKAVMYQINQQIQSQEDNRYIIYQNGRLGVYDFTAFDHPNALEYITDGTESGSSPQYVSASDYVDYIRSDGTVDPEVVNLKPTVSTSDAISGMNAAVYSGNPAGAYIQERIRKSRSKHTIDDILNSDDLYNNLMSSNGGRDYLDELQTTSRLLTGIYGYMVSSAFGRDDSKFIANAGDIESFTRQFWDASLGGLGGETAEISRRFLPEFSRRHRFNPLMSAYAEKYPWLPEKFFIGDPFTKIQNGEARLPGAGYEAINQLHTDSWGYYGAIDRYKILADIAPNSREYKYWKQIVKMMNTDEAKKVLKDTEEMVRYQGKKHDFFNYKFLGKDTIALNGTIEEILSNGKFKIAGDDRLYQIAGIKFKEDGFVSQQQLQAVIELGQQVTLRIDDEERNSDISLQQAPIKAALFVDGENISDTLREIGLADYDMTDSSAAGAYANYGLVGRLFGSAAELVTHAQIPILHSQFMRINDPLEEYRSDQLYGTGFASWDNIIDTMLMPTFEQSKTSIARDIIADTAYRYYKLLDNRTINDGVSMSRYKVTKFASTYLDGPALAGEIAGRFTFVGANAAERREKISRAFRFAGNTFAMATSLDDPLYATYAWGRMGYDIGTHVNIFKDFIKDEHMFASFFDSVDTKVGNGLIDMAKRTRASRILQTMAFAGTGLTISASRNTLGSLFGMDKVYTPEDVKERWDVEDYFDRLRYIKYMGLYEAARDKAISEEGVDVNKLYDHQEALRAEMNGEVSLSDMMASVLTSGKPSNDPLAQWVSKSFGKLSEDMTTLAAGEWTEKAIMYRQVAESTMYALNKDSEYSDIIRALPVTEKEYFIEFAKVTDERKRRQILRNVSPSLEKALKLVWYQEDTEVESNESFFASHNLPGPLWAGWNAQSNLEDIKAKVIYNEGMQYADFGIYSSKYEEPEVINAPNISNIYDGDDPLTVRVKMKTILNGVGLSDDQLNVYPTQNPGVIDVVTNVTSVLGYKIERALSFL